MSRYEMNEEKYLHSFGLIHKSLFIYRLSLSETREDVKESVRN